MRQAKLVIFSGLPGSGKTTLARMLSVYANAAFVRIDTIEQALRDLCEIAVEGEGYRLAYRVAADNLRLGQTVIADSCNPIELTRREWRSVAENEGCACVEVEVICSDPEEHRRRVEIREADIDRLILPTWLEVQSREYHPWTTDRVVVDTAGATPEESFRQLLDFMERRLT